MKFPTAMFWASLSFPHLPCTPLKGLSFYTVSSAGEAMLIFALALVLSALTLAKLLERVSNVPFSRLRLLRCFKFGAT